jgi:signal transduction histidine kinase
MLAPNVDFWAGLFFPLVLQDMNNFTQRTGFLITGILTIVMIIFMLLGVGFGTGLPLIIINAVIYFFLATLIAVVGEAEAAREESRRQQAELMATQETLRQSEMEKAITTERNRLAHELHDSVTQSLYSLTLFTEAARHIAEEQDLKDLEQHIKQIGIIGLQALKEMRLLVYELQPPELERDGLVLALRRRLEAVEGRAGVEARVAVDEYVKLPGYVERELFRVAMEALNNALKHAAAASVIVYLRQDNMRVEMEIVDDGVGFNSKTALGSGGMGLISIQERVDQLGGKLTIQSTPGEGSSVKVTIDNIDNITQQDMQYQGEHNA